MKLNDSPPPRYQEWMRADPDYDDPLDKLDTWEMLALVPIAAGLFIGLLVFIVFVFVMLAPE